MLLGRKVEKSGRLAKFMGIYGKVFRNSELRLMARMYHVAVREAMLHGRQSLRLWEVRSLNPNPPKHAVTAL